jgi:ribosomal protein S18 acetylase RimI-like enzyme
MDDEDSSACYGLTRPELAHKPLFDQFYSTCKARLSDYGFASSFIWRDAARLGWRVISDCLCLFANGPMGMTLLQPPVGLGNYEKAVRGSVETCNDYNNRIGLPTDATCFEYVSDEQLARFPSDFSARPMSGDYIYETRRMIELDGSDLASKRQARNRFIRRYQGRTEEFGPQHVKPCLEVLRRWHHQHDDSTCGLSPITRMKRLAEESATADAISFAGAIGLRGMVLYDGPTIVGFTFGEMIGPDMCNILIEKTDRQYAGSAQYIYAEFCRQFWPHTRWTNAGDDWEIPSLAYTKTSYKPAFRLNKWSVRPIRRQMVPVSLPAAWVADRQDLLAAAGLPTDQSHADTFEQASPSDIDALVGLENRTFDDYVALGRRQFRYLLNCPRATTHIVRHDGIIVAAAVLLRRKTRSGTTGRLYSIAVEPQFRGKGIGKTLLLECLDVLRRDSVSACGLEVDDDNKAAIALYENVGFKKVRILPHYYGQSKHGWKMKLNLAAATAPLFSVTTNPMAERLPANQAGAMALAQSAHRA